MCDTYFDIEEARRSEFAPWVREVVRSSRPWSVEGLMQELALRLPGLCDESETCPHGSMAAAEWRHTALLTVSSELADMGDPVPASPPPPGRRTMRPVLAAP